MTAAIRPIEVLLVDDHPMLLEGLRFMLDQHPEVAIVGMAKTGAEALALAASLLPDVLVLDLDLPDINGSEVITQLDLSATKVVVLSAQFDPDRIATAFDNGAIGFVPKTEATESLLDAIIRAFEGKASLPPEFVNPLFSGMRARKDRRNEADQITDLLSAREQEVLRSLAQGKTVTECAGVLHISVFTVRGHVRNILSKLGLHSMAQAVALAHRSGLVEAWEPR
jgi:DNA-binding NarL/FixJ family response regulator